MINKVIDYLLRFAVLNPKDMTGFKVYDVSGIASAIMKLELIYTEIFSLFFRLYKLIAVIGCIDTLETLFINLLDRVFT